MKPVFYNLLYLALCPFRTSYKSESWDTYCIHHRPMCSTNQTCVKPVSVWWGGEITTVHFNTTSWAGGCLTCLPVLHVAAQGLHTHGDSTDGEVGLDIWVWVSLQGLDNINDICVTKGRKHTVSFLPVDAD